MQDEIPYQPPSLLSDQAAGQSNLTISNKAPHLINTLNTEPEPPQTPVVNRRMLILSFHVFIYSFSKFLGSGGQILF
jgi:hypothetical protein